MPTPKARPSVEDVLAAIVQRTRDGAILNKDECDRLEREIGTRPISRQDWLRFVERSVDQPKGKDEPDEAKQDRT